VQVAERQRQSTGRLVVLAGQGGRDERAFWPARGPLRTGPNGPSPLVNLAGPVCRIRPENTTGPVRISPGPTSGPRTAAGAVARFLPLWRWRSARPGTSSGTMLGDDGEAPALLPFLQATESQERTLALAGAPDDDHRRREFVQLLPLLPLLRLPPATSPGTPRIRRRRPRHPLSSSRSRDGAKFSSSPRRHLRVSGPSDVS
jgi:hypothetical protein